MFLSVAYRHTDNADKNASNVIKLSGNKIKTKLYLRSYQKVVFFLFLKEWMWSQLKRQKPFW